MSLNSEHKKEAASRILNQLTNLIKVRDSIKQVLKKKNQKKQMNILFDIHTKPMFKEKDKKQLLGDIAEVVIYFKMSNQLAYAIAEKTKTNISQALLSPLMIFL